MGDVKTIRAVIVDDEPLARRGLVLRLAGVDDVEIVGEFGNGADAVAGIRGLRPDLVFLDIQMPAMDGFEVLRRIESPDMPAVIFATAYDEHAVRAFETRALDYLLKPIDEDRLSQSIDRVRVALRDRGAVAQRDRLVELLAEVTGEPAPDLDALLEEGAAALGRESLRVLPIRDGGHTIRLPTDAIDWIDAAGDYMCVHAQGKTHILRGTMKKLEEALDPRQFQRIHRSTIVNVERVREVRSHINGEYFLILPEGVELKMSRNYRDRIRRFLPEL